MIQWIDADKRLPEPGSQVYLLWLEVDGRPAWVPGKAKPAYHEYQQERIYPAVVLGQFRPRWLANFAGLQLAPANPVWHMLPDFQELKEGCVKFWAEFNAPPRELEKLCFTHFETADFIPTLATKND